MIRQLEQIERASIPNISRVSDLSFRRYFYESFDSKSPLCLILKGQRGVGKTTSIYQYLAQSQRHGRKVFYLPADVVTVRDISLVDIAEYLTSIGTQVLAIDEIQKRNNFADELKSIRDLYPDLELIASGSSAVELESADLSRRALKVSCFGLSFREYLNLKFKMQHSPVTLNEIIKRHVEISNSISNESKKLEINLIEEFQKYLQNGYFPTSNAIDNKDVFYKTLRQAIDRTIETDLLSIYPTLNGSSVGKMKKLLTIISKAGPFVPDYAKLKTALDITSETTLKDYLYYLHKAEVIRLLPKKKANIGAMRKPEKIYLDNPNYLFAVAPEESSNVGTLRETFVYMSIDNHLRLNSASDSIFASSTGDFETTQGLTFEVGGKNKGFKQIAGVEDSYVIADDILHGSGRQLPMWILGYLW